MRSRRLRSLLGPLALGLTLLVGLPPAALAASLSFAVNVVSSLTGNATDIGANVTASTYDAVYGTVYGTVYDNGSGSYTVTANVSGNDQWVVGATYGGNTTQASVYENPSTPVMVTLDWPAASETVTASPASLAVGGQSTITAAVYDSTGATVANVPVTFTASGVGSLTTTGAVYTSVYGVATDTLTAATAGTSTVTASVYGITSGNTVQVTFTSPSTGPGSGPGSGGSTPPVTTSGSSTSSGSGSGAAATGIGGTASGTAAPTATVLQNAILAGNGKVTISVQPDANGQATVQLSSADLSTLAQTGGVLQIQTGTVTVNLPAADITPAALAANALLSGVNLQNAQVAFVIHVASVPTSVPAPASGTVTAVSQVFTFDLQVIAGGSTVDLENFAQPIVVQMPYTPTANTDPELLGAYRLDPNGGAPLYAGGIANASSNTLTVGLTHFSQYAVLQFQPTFADISVSWAAHDIAVAAAHAITNGLTATSFGPDLSLTRATFVTMLARSLGLQPSTAATPFADVSASAWYAGSVAAAFQAGLVQGTSATAFGPDQLVTREQMATLLARSAQYQGKNVTLSASAIATAYGPFADALTVDSWAYAGTAYAVQAGLIRGDGPTSIDPLGTATRAQAAAVLVRMLLGSTGN